MHLLPKNDAGDCRTAEQLPAGGKNRSSRIYNNKEEAMPRSDGNPLETNRRSGSFLGTKVRLQLL